MPPRRVDIVLAGYGRVGRALAALLIERGPGVAERCGLDLRLRRVITSRGVLDLPGKELRGGEVYVARVRDPVGGGAVAAARRGELPGPPEGGSTSPVRGLNGFPARQGVGVPPCEALASDAAVGDVLVDATPTDLASGQPGLTYLRAALQAGMHGVALSKGPLVVDWMGLQQLAARKGVRLMVSGATAAALPAGDTLVYSLTGAEVLSIEGVLNGTTNYILDRMEQGRMTYDEALAEAQTRGIAESDPRLDVEGWDTAAKMVILANLAWATVAPPGSGAASGAGSAGRPATLADVRVTGITSLSPEDLARSRRQGRILRLVGRALPPEEGDAPRIEVGPVDLPDDHPLARLAGANKGVTFATDLMGSVTVIGGESSPRAAAAAALKDIIHLYL